MTRQRWLLVALIAPFVLLFFLTLPPAMPDYARVRSDWKPSEAYLYDRHGVLLEERRVDFKARR
ncbi:MAG: hypothetical protein KGJ05_08910, partial [Alphaproteobacteria bacterium]|nr:hypothetical protein [Alphaproteobacteria bacterium]